MSHRCEQPCNNNRRIPFAFLWKQGERNDREGFDFPSRRDERRGIRGRLINHPEKIVRFLSKTAVSSWSPDPDNICSITRRTWLIYSPLPLWIDSLVLQSTLLESSLYLKMSMHRSTDGNRSSTQILLHRSCTDRSYIYIYIIRRWRTLELTLVDQTNTKNLYLFFSPRLFAPRIHVFVFW